MQEGGHAVPPLIQGAQARPLPLKRRSPVPLSPFDYPAFLFPKISMFHLHSYP